MEAGLLTVDLPRGGTDIVSCGRGRSLDATTETVTEVLRSGDIVGVEIGLAAALLVTGDVRGAIPTDTQGLVINGTMSTADAAVEGADCRGKAVLTGADAGDVHSVETTAAESKSELAVTEVEPQSASL